MPEKIGQIKLSIIVPIFNEEKSILILYNKIRETLKTFDVKSEIIFVDDGSTDSSCKVLRYLSKLRSDIRFFEFNLNKGQHKAIEKGFHEAQGEVVVTIDGDLQEEPRDISKLIAKLDEGFDVVCGWRSVRKDSWLKVLKSKIGNYLHRKITKLELHDMSCTMRAYRKSLVKNLILQEKYEVGFIPYILSKYTKRITEVKIKHHKRAFGKSKYGLLATTIGTIRCFIKLILGNAKNRIVAW
ncbi:MAG: hypothetical protein A2Z72_04675 [Omnitrophica bacterium RBG_13_46_9]|nr:MAG: hypothetical protein A2Z72_04675 [Omnitrophica bacterium RBG_13_46_9]